MKKHSVEIGDCFVKSETPRTVWVVQRIVDHPGLPLHACLKSRGLLNRNIVLSVSALVDRSKYQRFVGWAGEPPSAYVSDTGGGYSRESAGAVAHAYGLPARNGARKRPRQGGSGADSEVRPPIGECRAATMSRNIARLADPVSSARRYG